jgi:hypothetical protein
MYDIFNNDLCGFSYKNIEKEYKLAIELAWWIIEYMGEKMNKR